jgi:hypothetical protein
VHVLPNTPVPFFLQRGLLFLILLFAVSAGTPGQSPAADSPSATLRDALVAACSQNSTDFVKALTARNAEAFARMTPPARQTFLKRFVLLDKPGKPRSQNETSGIVVVYCETSELTTQMEIAKPELRDNLAYLPLTVKDSGDSSGLTAHQVTMGMVRESGQWKILSLGLLFLDLPSLEIEWDRAEMKANEQTAVASLKALVDAIETYRKTYTHLPESLKVLGPAPTANNAPKSDGAGLVGEDLAGGRKDGYSYRYVIVGANTSGAPAKYEVAAIPSDYGRSGMRSFFCDATGQFHVGDHKGAVGSDLDPKLEDAAPSASDPQH